MPCYGNILRSGIDREGKSIFTVGVDKAAVILLTEKLLVCLFFEVTLETEEVQSHTDLPYLQQKNKQKIKPISSFFFWELNTI